MHLYWWHPTCFREGQLYESAHSRKLNCKMKWPKVQQNRLKPWFIQSVVSDPWGTIFDEVRDTFVDFTRKGSEFWMFWYFQFCNNMITLQNKSILCMPYLTIIFFFLRFQVYYLYIMRFSVDEDKHEAIPFHFNCLTFGFIFTVFSSKTWSLHCDARKAKINQNSLGAWWSNTS